MGLLSVYMFIPNWILNNEGFFSTYCGALKNGTNTFPIYVMLCLEHLCFGKQFLNFNGEEVTGQENRTGIKQLR